MSWTVDTRTASPCSATACASVSPTCATSGSVKVTQGTTSSSHAVPDHGARPAKALPAAIRPCSSPTCVNCSRLVQSPAAHTVGPACSLSSVTTRPLSSCTPAVSSPSPSVAGLRPTATSRCEPATLVPSARCSTGPAEARTTWAPVRRETPSRSSTAVTAACASGSSRPRIVGAPSTTVTRDPSRRNAWASSTPIGPPPSTSRCSGSSRSENTVRLSRYGSSASPSAGGTSARDPVATTSRSKVVRRPSTSTLSGPVTTAQPVSRSMPCVFSSSGDSSCSTSATTRATRSMTARKSTRTSAVKPYASPERAACTRRAVSSSALLGTQP